MDSSADALIKAMIITVFTSHGLFEGGKSPRVNMASCR
jgi:hypothetical protein